jgi:hypothetical protein
MSQSACFGCPDNPQGSSQKAIDSEALRMHGGDISRIEKLHDAARMNLLGINSLPDLDFEMVRLYFWEIEKIRMQSGRIF